MMLLAWMVQATVLGALLSAAAVLLDALLVGRRRWIWVTVVLLSAAVPGLTLLAPSTWPEWLSWREAPALLLPAMPVGMVEAARIGSGRDGDLDPVRIGWTVLSLLCLTRYAAGWLRLRWLSRGCARARLAGVDLLLSERLGPAVVGLWRPRVVAPRWIMMLSAARQRMIVLHEAEHRRAGDHWVLAAAPLLAVLLPWNLALWWQLRRLRLAIELDCDARVLSRGVRPREYGGLLLDVAAANTALVAPGLAEPRSLLERRLEAVVGRQLRPGLARGLVRASGAVAAVVSGCLVAAPVRVVATSVSAAPAAPAPSPAEHGAVSGTSVVLTTTQDTVQRNGDSSARHTMSTGGKARRVARMQRAASGAGDVVAVSGSARVRNPVPAGLPVIDPEGSAHSRDTAAAQRVGGDSALSETPPIDADGVVSGPLFIIDGVIISASSFAGVGLEPDNIESIEIIKGSAAAALYGARAADGVVSITTKRRAAGR